MTVTAGSVNEEARAARPLPWEPGATLDERPTRLVQLADEILEKCRGEGPANCVGQCPLHVDARGYVQLAKEGRFDEALQRVRERLPFPGVLGYLCAHPCERHCKRIDDDNPIRVRDVKRFLADREEGDPRHILDAEPAKGKTVAVVGGGPAGLIAAHDLKRRGYTVTVFEKQAEIGGCLRYKIPEARLPRTVLERDLSIIDALGIEVKTGVHLGRDTSLLELRRSHDAVLLLVGYEGGIELLENKETGLGPNVRETLYADPYTCETGVEGVFSGGDAVSGPSTVIQSLALGRRAAESAHRYLAGENVAADRESPLPGRLLWTLEISEEERRERERTPVMLKPYNAPMTEEEVLAEGERCLDCECGLCVKDCEFLTKHCDSPKDLARRIKAGLDDEETRKIAFSCNICQLCESVCPEKLDTGAMMLEARREWVHEHGVMKQHGGIVGYWSFGSGQGWKSMFSFVMPEPGRQKSKQLFFVGCALPSVGGDNAVAVYNELRKHYPGTGVVQLCCGAPVELIGDEERFHQNKTRLLEMMDSVGAEELWAACPDCTHALQENYPEIKTTAVWEKLAGVWKPPRKRDGDTLSIHDSCKARYMPELQSAVRTLLTDGGATIEDVEYKDEKSRCCGFGGMIDPIDGELRQKITNRRAGESEHPMITYCAGCRMALHSVQKPAAHILDALFTENFAEEVKKNPPGIVSRYLNRIKTKRKFKRLRPLGSE